MRIHDVHDFDAARASRELLEIGFTAVNDVSGELIDCAKDELFEKLGFAGDEIDLRVDKIQLEFTAYRRTEGPGRSNMALIENLKRRAQHLKAETFALYLAARDPRTPWYAKLLAAGIVAYALSPIDLIPDFIPILGYLDDLILIPLGIALAIKLAPHSVLVECRARARETMRNGGSVSRVAGVVIVVIWLLLAGFCVVWAYQAFIAQS